MKFTLHLLAFILFNVCLPWTTPAQIMWESLKSPYGGGIFCAAKNNIGVTVAIQQGSNCQIPFHSTDDGRTWTRHDTTLLVIKNLAPLPDGGFIATSRFGAHITRDAGRSWLLTNLKFDCNAVCATATGNILINTNGYDNYRSSDNGTSWKYLGKVPAALRAFSSSTQGKLYACTDNGLYSSSDEGVVWDHLGLSIMSVMCVITDSVGTITCGTPSGIYLSSDGGKSWICGGLTTLFISSLCRTTNGVIFAATDDGVFLSFDHGLSWTQSSLRYLQTYSLLYYSDDSIGITTESGFYVSFDRGITWKQTGLEYVDVFNEIVHDRDGNIFVGSSIKGVFRFDFKKQEWINLFIPRKFDFHSIGPRIYAMITDPDNRLYVSTSDGVYATTSGSSGNWTLISSGLSNTYVEGLAVDVQGNVYAASHIGLYVLSADRSKWNETALKKKRLTTVATINTSHIFAGTWYEGIHRTTNGGDSWQRADTAFVTNVINFIVALSNGYVFAVGDDQWIYRSSDYGGSWKADYSMTDRIFCITANEQNHLFIGTVGRVLRTIDAGQSWQQFGVDFAQKVVLGMTIDTHGFVYVVTSGAGIFRSTQSTLTIHEKFIDSRKPVVSSLRIAPNPFSQETTIRYTLASPSHVKLSVFDLFGRNVATLVDGEMEAGEQEFVFPRKNLSSGVYTCVVTSNGKIRDTKMLIVR